MGNTIQANRCTVQQIRGISDLRMLLPCGITMRYMTAGFTSDSGVYQHVVISLHSNID